jgi:hypothetical protein
MTAHVPRSRRRLTPVVRVNTHRMCPLPLPPPCLRSKNVHCDAVMSLQQCFPSEKVFITKYTALRMYLHDISKSACACVCALRTDSHDRGCGKSSFFLFFSFHFLHPLLFSFGFICTGLSLVRTVAVFLSHASVCITARAITPSSRRLDVMGRVLGDKSACALVVRYYNGNACTTRTSQLKDYHYGVLN